MALIESANPYPPVGIYNMYMNIMNEKYSFNHVKTIAHNWEALNKNQEVAFNRLMDVFEACTLNDTRDNIKTIFNIINEDVLQKVRSGPQAQECMNRKIGKFKIQARKVKTRIRTANKNIPNTKAAADKYEKEHPVKEEDLELEDFVENCYEELINTSRKYDQCDRILLNNDKLNKRFNFDKTIRESSFVTEEDVTDCIRTLCEYVDTYNIDTKVKYNTCLENIYYSFNRNNRQVSKEKILGDVTDYFLLRNSIDENYLDDIRYIVTESKVYDMDDFRNVSYLFESEDDRYIEENLLILEAKKEKEDKKKKEKPLSKREQKKLEKQSKPRYSINDFKKSENKTIKGFRDLLNRIYNNSPENIGLEIGNIFTIIRYTFIVGAFGINPILGIVTMVTDFIMKTETGRNELPRYIKKYKAEIKLVEKNIDKAKSDEEKAKLKAYKKQLEDCVRNMEDKLDSLYTEKENDERHAKEDEEEYNESVNLLLSILDNTNTIFEEKEVITDSIVNALKTVSIQEDISNIVDFCCTVPYMVNMRTVKETLEDMRDDARNANTKDYMKIMNLNECISSIENLESNEPSICDEPYRVYNYTNALRECMTDVIDCVPVPDNITHSINEDKKSGLSMTSKLKISLDKLRKSAENLSDKEKAVSKQIDISVDTLAKNAERALVSSNREAVIKGTIIPSASKCIKGAIVTGAAWAVSPAIAVIGLLGAIGTSKKLQSKERQLILDDIEIELNMCERYMKMAEEKNDMQAQRHILQTQRELLRQKQRLQYNMQVKFREKTPPKLNSSHTEESMNITEEDIILERSGAKQRISKAAKKQLKKAEVELDASMTSGSMENTISDLHKKEIKIGNTKIKNKTLTRKEMIEHPEVVKQYLKEEGEDPYVNLGNIFSIADSLFTIGVSMVSSSLAEWLILMICKRIIKNILNLMKIAANVLDPKVEVAIKTTKRKLLTYVHKIDKEIKYCDDPKKRKQLEKERDVLMSCYNDTVKETNIERKVR